MKRYVVFFTLATLLIILGTPATYAQSNSKEEETILRLLKERDKEIKSLLGNQTSFTEEQREKLKEVINANIDFEEMSRLALGPFWNDLTEAQRKEFVSVFSEIVRDHSLSNLDIYRAKVLYDSVRVMGDSAVVYTRAIYRDTPSRVYYVLKKKQNRWVVVDIILDDVSTVGGYARSFQNVIRRKGFDTLMKSLHRKLERIKQKEKSTG